MGQVLDGVIAWAAVTAKVARPVVEVELAGGELAGDLNTGSGVEAQKADADFSAPTWPRPGSSPRPGSPATTPPRRLPHCARRPSLSVAVRHCAAFAAAPSCRAGSVVHLSPLTQRDRGRVGQCPRLD
jgi:hypothetical protein